jgi:hypothetical protein
MVRVQASAFISALVGRYPLLSEQHMRLEQPRSETTANRLHCSAQSRLWLAIMRWAVRADLHNELPPGLEIIALPEFVFGDRKDGHPSMSEDSMLEDNCSVCLPAPILLPLLDQMLSTYDSNRGELWPTVDMLIQQTEVAAMDLHKVGEQKTFLLEERARSRFKNATRDLNRLLPQQVLSYLKPQWLQRWTLHVTSERVCPCHSAIVSICLNPLPRPDLCCQDRIVNGILGTLVPSR